MGLWDPSCNICPRNIFHEAKFKPMSIYKNRSVWAVGPVAIAVYVEKNLPYCHRTDASEAYTRVF